MKNTFKSSKSLHDDTYHTPIVVPQWLIDAEIARALTPEGRQNIIADLRYCRDHGMVLGDWVLPEE